MATPKPRKPSETPCAHPEENHTSTYGISSPAKMSRLKEGLVWVGFINDLPVISSVKEAVEFVLAKAGKDPRLAAEKERVMRAKLGLEEKRNSGGSSGSSSGFCSGDEREAVRVEERKLLAYIKDRKTKQMTERKDDKTKQSRKRSSGPSTSTIPAKVMRHEGEETTDEETTDEHTIKNHQVQQTLQRPPDEPKRGHHVINNDVTKFHSKVLKNDPRRTGQTVSCPLAEESQKAITSKMVEHFETELKCEDANGMIYGQCNSDLRKALLQFLQDGSQESKNRASKIIKHMNQYNVFVDPLAKAKWIAKKSENLEKFTTIRNEVAEMFENTVPFFEKLRNPSNSSQ